MKKNKTKDLTTGSPFRLVLGFAVPLLFGLLFQQVYNLVDTIIVGKFLGVKALAAVGATGSINFLILGFCNGMCSGFALPIAQRFGAKDEKGLRKYVGNSAVLALLFGLLITAATTLLCRNILSWMHTPDDIVKMSYSYIVIIFLGIPCTILYNLLSGYIRSLGDSVTPLVFLVISASLNIGLDLLFLVQFGMNVSGAALATVISQGVSGILCLYYIIRKFDILHLSRDDWHLQPACVRVLLGMGLPMGFQYSITAIGSVILQTSVNGLGSLYVASMASAQKISMFLVCPFDALGATMATYGGQNVGAGKLSRLGRGLRAANIIGACYSLFALTILWFFGKYFLLLFVSAEETQVITNARHFLIANALFYFPLALVNIVRFLIQGMGFSGLAVFAGLAEMVARTTVGLFLVPVFGFNGACLANPSAWILADLFLIPAYYAVYRKLSRRLSG